MRISSLSIPVVLLSGLLAAAQTPAPSPSSVAAGSSEACAGLAHFALPNSTVASASMVAAGAFNGPAQVFTGIDMSAFYKKLPAFCRVVVHAHPSSDSDIVIEVWMPTAWKGRLQGLGNGGFAGLIDTYELGAAILNGNAAVATDTGHTGSPIDAAWALNHPEKIEDFGHRGIHEMTRVAKLVVEHFYQTAAKRSYFAGCSDGGREALMEAQRYPADYDGILAGAPANNWTDLLSMAVVDTQALTDPPANFIPQAKIATIAKAVVAACDKLDGVADGILNDPRQCRFDPATIRCKQGDANNCLTAQQVIALKVIYGGLKDSTGRTVFPGYLPGGEEGPGGWGTWITGPAPVKSVMSYFGKGYFSDMVYNQPAWDYETFTFDAGLRDAKQKTAAALDAVNPDLSAFRARGGKLILYHGWNDPAIPALSTVNYYNAVVSKAGRSRADSFVRLYMVPGMQHCSGGPGADQLGQDGTQASDLHSNARTALVEWVEKGTAPDTLIATKTASGTPQGAVTMTRPLCPFPQTAKYKGAGDTNKAESFVCASSSK